MWIKESIQDLSSICDHGYDESRFSTLCRWICKYLTILLVNHVCSDMDFWPRILHRFSMFPSLIPRYDRKYTRRWRYSSLVIGDLVAKMKEAYGLEILIHFPLSKHLLLYRPILQDWYRCGPVGMRIVNDSNPKLRDMAEYSFGTVLIPWSWFYPIGR